MLLVASGSCAVFAQKAGCKCQDVVKDTVALDSQRIADGTIFRLYTFRRDTMRHEMKYGSYRNTFKYDAFREKMKEPWLDGILKNIIFR